MFHKSHIPVIFSVLSIATTQAAIRGSDNFDDNQKDTAKWGADENEDSGLLLETAQHLQYTAGGTDTTKTAYRPWQLNSATYDTDWEITLDLTNSASFASGDKYASIGLEIFPAANPGKSAYVSMAASSDGPSFSRVFETSLLDGGNAIGFSTKPAAAGGSVRVTFNAATKVLSFYNDADGPAGGYSWSLQSTYGIAGPTTGTTGNAAWAMSGADAFKVYINGYSYGTPVTEGTLYADNFSATTATTAITLAAKNITSSSASLNGTVHPNGLETTVFFEWATDPDFLEFETTPPQIIPANAQTTPVSANVTDLSPSSPYYIRLRATNSAGSVAGNPITFTTAASTEGPFSLTTNATTGAIGINPPGTSYPPNTLVTLTATPPAGQRFLGWSGSVTGTQNPITVVMDQPKTAIANFSSTIAQAADQTELIFTTGGAAPWFGQGLVSHDGVDAVRSGAIGDSQESWFQTTINGAGELSFWWKVSSEPSDELELLVDGIYRNSISNQDTWTKQTLTFTDGSHTLRWRYKKDINLFGGQDAGWVDEIKWTPAAPNFAAWSSLNFTPAELLDASVSGPNADPDHDGVVNLLEFALGGGPKDGTARPSPVMGYETISGQTYLTLSVAKPTSAVSGITYVIQVSSDLNQWFSAGTFTTVMTDSSSTLKVRDNLSLSSAGKRFIRLQVSSAP